MRELSIPPLSHLTEDPYPSSSIDLKCKERVTDSDSDNASGDESSRKVNNQGSTSACLYY